MSFISLFIITLVTWLTLVFLSVADGIEKGWIQRLTSIHGPLKVIPTEEYYASHYNKIDLYSHASKYTQKSLKEKRFSNVLTAFNPEIDEELPEDFPSPIVDREGQPVDVVKKLFSCIETLSSEFPKVKGEEYEITGAMMRLKIFSPKTQGFNLISQASYIMSIDPISASLLPDPVEQKTSHTPIFLPKSFEESGAKIHDVGQLTIYNGMSMGSVEENNLFEVVGFYNAGTLQIGPKCLFAPYSFVSELAHQGQMESIDPILSSGIRLHIDPISSTPLLAKRMEQLLEKEGLSPYFQIVPYYEYSFVKDILTSFQSDRLLYSFVALLVLIVAASNIVSVLLLIVYQSRRDIALFTALGASKKSLVRIYAGLGFLLGSLGSFFGLILASATMANMPFIMHNIQILKGYENLFSQSIPTSLSPAALLVVLVGTPIIALIAGLIPAIKASRYKPSELLRLI
ncbi:MAG: ABC transporter permease [Chlamydiia bacterium]